MNYFSVFVISAMCKIIEFSRFSTCQSIVGNTINGLKVTINLDDVSIPISGINLGQILENVFFQKLKNTIPSLGHNTNQSSTDYLQ